MAGERKRPKRSRYRGTHTHGRGAKKKARGKGHRGGVGMAGTGKRADQKKASVLKKGVKYFGVSKTRRGDVKIVIPIVNLGRVAENVDSFVKDGVGKKNGDLYELNFKNKKIIGDDSHGVKMKIHALAASKGSVRAVKRDGGEIIIIAKKVKKVSEEKK